MGITASSRSSAMCTAWCYTRPPKVKNMSIPWVDYVQLMGLFLGSGGIGMAWGQWRLSIREMFDASGS